MNSGLSDKDRIKFEKSNSKLKGAKSQQKNHEVAVKSGRGSGELVHSGQRDTTQSEGSKAEQKSTMQRKDAAEKAAKIAKTNKLNNAAQESGVVNSSGSADKAIKVPSNQNFLGEVNSDLPSDALTYKSGSYSDLFGAKGKSAPARKMAGNRSNKSGSAFKMKGYGKR
jgi:hypothetical protein